MAARIVTVRAQRLKKIQSRLKCSIPLEIFNLAWKFQSRPSKFPTKNRGLVGGALEIFNPAWIGRTPKGAYSTRGRSRHLLETPFWEPLLRNPSQNPFYCKPHSRPPSQNPSENPSPEPCPEPSQNPSQNAVLPYAPLGVHPIEHFKIPEGHMRHLGVARQNLSRDNFCRCLVAQLPSRRG